MRSVLVLLLSAMALSFMCSCAGKPGKVSGRSFETSIEDSLTISQIDEDLFTEFDEDIYVDHPEEWPVIRNIMHKHWYDYPYIDSLVHDYILKKGIQLPVEKADEIKMIDEICKDSLGVIKRYDISRGLHLADEICWMFGENVNLLWKKEALKAQGPDYFTSVVVEEELYDNFYFAMYLVCDSVAFRMSYPYEHMGEYQLMIERQLYKKHMLQNLSGIKPEIQEGVFISKEAFDKELEAVKSRYLYGEDYPYINNYQETKFANLRTSFFDWYDYRKKVASMLPDNKFRRDYDSLTDCYAWKFFQHLQNRFLDVGKTGYIGAGYPRYPDSFFR